jgi:hypothetical protein
MGNTVRSKKWEQAKIGNTKENKKMKTKYTKHDSWRYIHEISPWIGKVKR